MPSKRAKLSHPSPKARALSDEEAEDEEVVDEIEEDEKDADEAGEEVIEEIEEEDGEEEDEQQEVGDQEDYASDENQETDADNEEDVEEEEEEVDKEVIEEEEEEEEEVEIEIELEEEEEEVEEEGAGARETERGDLGEEEGDAEYEGDEVEDVEHVDDHDADSRDEDAAGVEEDVEEADGAGGDAEEDDEADEDVHDTDADSHDAVKDANDADEGSDGESREQLDMEEDEDGDGEEDDDDDDEDEHTEELGTEDGDADDERRRQLAILMCFSSLQSLMATEICRDTTPPFDEIGIEESSSLPGAFLKLMLLAVTSLMQEEGRQCWKLQRSGQEWRHIERGVSSTDAATRDSIWRRKYSMSYACFLYLVEELRPFIQSESQVYVRAPLEIERAVAMVLYRFAHGLSAREVAEKYNVGASTVGKYTLIVASALAEANKLYGRYVAIPTGDRMARIISQFQQITNVSHMCGAIDGTHIRLNFKPDKWCSTTSPSYESTQKSHSILLQAVCDANKLFWDVCCVTPVGAHEAAHFIASNLYQNIREELSLQEPVLTLDNKEVTPYMVGDSAYPIRTFLIKPFDTDDPLRRAFDEQLRKGSACIDGAFGILKTRWKILKCMNVHPMHAPRIAIACCVLHNICQLWGEPEPPQQETRTHSTEQTHGSAAAYEIDEAAKIAGETAREALFRDWVKRSLENPHVSLDQENTFSGQN